jgi:hypothetical protein
MKPMPKKIKGEKKERFVISISPTVKAKAHSKAVRERKGFSEIIEALLYDWSAE